MIKKKKKKKMIKHIPLCVVNFRPTLKMKQKPDTSGDDQQCNVVAMTEEPNERPTGIPVAYYYYYYN